MNKHTIFYQIASEELLNMRFAAGKSATDQPEERNRWYAGYNLMMTEKKHISMYFSFENTRAALQLACTTREEFIRFVSFIESLLRGEEKDVYVRLESFKNKAYSDRWAKFEDSYELKSVAWLYIVKQLSRLPHKELLAALPGYWIACLD